MKWVDFFVKIGLTLLGTALAFIPSYLYLILRHFLSPEGFWQEAIVLGFGFYVFSTAQLFLFLALLVALCTLWSEF